MRAHCTPLNRNCNVIAATHHRNLFAHLFQRVALHIVFTSLTAKCRASSQIYCVRPLKPLLELIFRTTPGLANDSARDEVSAHSEFYAYLVRLPRITPAGASLFLRKEQTRRRRSKQHTICLMETTVYSMNTEQLSFEYAMVACSFRSLVNCVAPT